MIIHTSHSSFTVRFNEAHFYGKYGYAYFESEHYASVARHVLRSETNLVVSFAKNAPKPLSMAFSEQQNFFTLDGYQVKYMRSSIWRDLD